MLFPQAMDVRKFLHFCSTNHSLRNKISLPALPDYNAGKLLVFSHHYTGRPPFACSAIAGWLSPLSMAEFSPEGGAGSTKLTLQPSHDGPLAD
jgi:hypothetical protein